MDIVDIVYISSLYLVLDVSRAEVELMLLL